VALFRERDSHALYLLEKAGSDAAGSAPLHLHGASRCGTRAACGRTAGAMTSCMRSRRGRRGRRPGRRPAHRLLRRLDRACGRCRIDRWSAARTSWSAPSRCSAAAAKQSHLRRRGGRGKTALAEGWPPPSRSARSRHPQGRAAVRARSGAPCSPGRSSAASSRSGSRRLVKSLAEKPGAILFHRRDPHAGRRRRDQRRVDGRLESLEAGLANGELRCIAAPPSTTSRRASTATRRWREGSRRSRS